MTMPPPRYLADVAVPPLLPAPGERPVLAPRSRPAASARAYLDQRCVRSLLLEPVRCELEHIRGALDRADYHDAAARALARAKLGLPLPAALVAELLVGIERCEVFLILVRCATGNTVEALLALLRRGRFANDPGRTDHAALLAFALWSLEPSTATRAAILPPLRRVVRWIWLRPRIIPLVDSLVAQLEDPHLTALHEEHLARAPLRPLMQAGPGAPTLWTASIDDVIAGLHERSLDRYLPAEPAGPPTRVGRNDPCPCGTGKKFKRCCAHRPPAAAAPMSRADELRALEPTLTREQIMDLPRGDVAQLDLSRLSDSGVRDVLHRQLRHRDWRRALAAVDEDGRRRGRKAARAGLQEMIQAAIVAHELDVARDLIARLGDDGAAADLRLALALAERVSDAPDELEAAARAAISGEGEISTLEIARAALHSMPALGILLARGAIAESDDLDIEALRDAVEDARDELLLPPGDPIQQICEALRSSETDRAAVVKAEAARSALAATAEALRANLHDTSTRLAEVERGAEAHRRELARAEQILAEVNRRADPGDRDERALLRGKIDRLEGLLRDGNTERADLRRQLAQATPRADETSTSPRGHHHLSVVDEDDEADHLPDASSARLISIPHFSDESRSSLASVPRHVAAETLRTVGTIAAGDPAAWRRVKQARDMPRQVLMARVGISYRLLFRVDTGALDIIDLIPRGSLSTVLRRLRSR